MGAIRRKREPGQGPSRGQLGQLSRGSRWGDYTTMNIDPSDDCTFWYVNEYIQKTEISLAPWQTRIASFSLPGCE